MDAINKIGTMSTRVRFSTLWIVIVVNIAMADIFGFMMDLMKGPITPEVQVPEVGMLAFAALMEIPIAMIFLSRVLKYRANRRLNIVACIITTAFVVVGGSANLVYGFFAAAEILCMFLIVWRALKWHEGEE
jgi:hypothetical protein